MKSNKKTKSLPKNPYIVVHSHGLNTNIFVVWADHAPSKLEVIQVCNIESYLEDEITIFKPTYYEL